MSEKVRIKAIGYDVDGTMVDSEPLHNSAWFETLHHYGHDFSELPLDFQNSMAGRKPIAIATFMIQTLHIDTSPEEFLSKKHAKFLEKVKTDLRPMPGVVESIKRLSSQYALGIGTSLDREYIALVLSKLGVTGYFKIIVTGDEIKNGKPHPETYLTLCDRMGIKPEEMLVLEDAKSGIESAKAAGCLCIAVKNRNAPDQDASKADKTVDSLDEVTEELISDIVR